MRCSSSQSDNFAEGERPESPVAVGEKLSREATPQPKDEDDPSREITQSPPVPGTPERGLYNCHLTLYLFCEYLRSLSHL